MEIPIEKQIVFLLGFFVLYQICNFHVYLLSHARADL